MTVVGEAASGSAPLADPATDTDRGQHKIVHLWDESDEPLMSLPLGAGVESAAAFVTRAGRLTGAFAFGWRLGATGAVLVFASTDGSGGSGRTSALRKLFADSAAWRRRS